MGCSVIAPAAARIPAGGSPWYAFARALIEAKSLPGRAHGAAQTSLAFLRHGRLRVDLVAAVAGNGRSCCGDSTGA